MQYLKRASLSALFIRGQRGGLGITRRILLLQIESPHQKREDWRLLDPRAYCFTKLFSLETTRFHAAEIICERVFTTANSLEQAHLIFLWYKLSIHTFRLYIIDDNRSSINRLAIKPPSFYFIVSSKLVKAYLVFQNVLYLIWYIVLYGILLSNQSTVLLLLTYLVKIGR